MNVLVVAEEIKEYAIRPFPKSQTIHAEFSEDKSSIILVEKLNRQISIYSWKDFETPTHQIVLSCNYFRDMFCIPLHKLYMLAPSVFLFFLEDNSFRLLDSSKTQGMFFMKHYLTFDFKPTDSTLWIFELNRRTAPVVFSKSIYYDRTILTRVVAVI